MRVEPHAEDSIIHVTKRGTRGLDIVRDVDDQKRFVKSLFLLNDTHTDPYWYKATTDLPMFERPSYWPEREPLVRILAWTLLSNHFHLLFQEIQDGGMAKFMQRLGGSMSMCFNIKHDESGSLFQSGYHGRTVDKDSHLKYLAFYILVKNVLEMYPGGLKAALENFDHAWEWAIHYEFSSLPGIISGEPTPIIEDPEGLIAEVIGKGNSFKEEARQLLVAHMVSHGKDFKEVMLEPW